MTEPAAEYFLRQFAENPQCRNCDPRHVKWALAEIERLQRERDSIELELHQMAEEIERLTRERDALRATIAQMRAEIERRGEVYD